ncbi:MAG: hypothetical protein HYT07_01395 [Candidatus Levybacteria bacterium]|nr:hypothetical protein [Candidatus Levybacteria bacterium]
MSEGAFSPDRFKEQVVPNQESGESIDRETRCLFLAAATYSNAGIEGIRESLIGQYGNGKVDTFNSIFSPDPENPERFNQIAQVIKDNVKGGLDIIAHSLGASELQRAIRKITSEDEAFFDKKENTEKIKIILFSPSGFNKGIIGRLRYLARTFRFNRAEGNWPISKSETLPRGIDALTAFPPEGITSEDLENSLRKAIPELSQYREGVERIPSGESKDNVSSLTEDQFREYRSYSNEMLGAINSKNYEKLRQLIASYGKIFMDSVNKICEGKLRSAKEGIAEASKVSVGGRIELLRTLINATGSSPMKELSKLQQKGVGVYFVFPEYDIFMKLDQAIAFFDGSDEASQHIKIQAGATHVFPALAPKQFTKSVRDIV